MRNGTGHAMFYSRTRIPIDDIYYFSFKIEKSENN
jgi:hypothetical protein